MSREKPLSVSVELTCCGAATLRQPDRLRLVFDEPLLRSIAKALAILGALNEIGAWATLPLSDAHAIAVNGLPWAPSSDEGGNFVVSSIWMHVESDRLHIEIWEAHGDDELRGFVEFADHPAVCSAAERQMRWAEEELLQGLCTDRGDVPVTAPVLVRALRLASRGHPASSFTRLGHPPCRRGLPSSPERRRPCPRHPGPKRPFRPFRPTSSPTSSPAWCWPSRPTAAC